MGQSSDSSIRISDAERDLAVTALWEHLGTGRLDPAEHEERCTKAAVARTRAELEELFADLPAPHPDLSAAVPPTELTTKPATDLKETDGDALAGVGVVILMFGLPAAIYLTVRHNLWWTFYPVVGLTLLFWVLSDLVEKRRRDG
jgi:hypothetical protein